MKEIVLIGSWGFIGSVARYLCTLLFSNSLVVILSVNIIGSFLIGILTGIDIDQNTKKYLTIGLCGGFTTFSMFSLQNYQMITSGDFSKTMIYTMSSILSVYCGSIFWVIVRK